MGNDRKLRTDLYRHRHVAERMINRLKRHRRVATRYEKWAANGSQRGRTSCT